MVLSRSWVKPYLSLDDRGWEAVFILFVVLTMFVGNKANWVYSMDFDSHHFSNAFTNPLGFLKEFPDDYQMDRMPWILAGGALGTFLSPLNAELVLHLVVFLVFFCSFYFAARIAFGPRSAVISSLLLIVSPTALAGIGTSYVSAPVITCLSAGIYFLIVFMRDEAEGRTNWRSVVLASLFLAGAVSCHVWSMVIVTLTFIALFLSGGIPLRRIAPVLGIFGGVSLSLLLAVCTAYYLIQGEFLYFMSTLNIGGRVYFSATSWADTSIPLYVRALFLSPFVILACGVVFLVASSMHGHSITPMQRFAVLMFLLIIGLMVTLFLMERFQVTKPNRYSFVIPAMYLCVAAILSGFLRQLSRHQFKAVAGFMTLGLTTPFWVMRRIEFSETPLWLPALFALCFLGALAVMKHSVFRWRCGWRKRRLGDKQLAWRFRFAIIGHFGGAADRLGSTRPRRLPFFLSAALMLTPAPYLLDGNGTFFQIIADDLWMPALTPRKRDALRAISQGVSFANDNCADFRCVFWYDDQDPMVWIMQSIRSIRSAHVPVNDFVRLPKMKCDEMARIPKLVLITSSAEQREQAYDTIAACGRRFEVLDRQDVDQGEVRIGLEAVRFL